MIMDQTYTREQAMERLGIKRMSDFRRFERMYPQVFMNVNPGVHRDTQRLYDKTAIEKFADTLEKLRQPEG
jgi:hypothetical protein